MAKNSEISIKDAWQELVDTYPIVEEIEKNGVYHIDASIIRGVKEPRLMVKWDSIKHVPEPLREHNITILPTTRGTYVLGKFKLFQNLPENFSKPITIDKSPLEGFESFNLNDISSEANAINGLDLLNLLPDFLETSSLYRTFNGRMKSEQFDFNIDSCDSEKENIQISVDNAQIEIDAGYENNDCIVIVEAKNTLNKDFNIRQLYYPYRCYLQKTQKPIRLVFSIYFNKVYRLLEYRFKDPMDYSSIELVKERCYSLIDTSITEKDLIDIFNKTKVKYTDEIGTCVFPQADDISKIFTLMDAIGDKGITKRDALQVIDVVERQIDYYYSAGNYLKLFDIENPKTTIAIMKLTSLGKKAFKAPYKEQQLIVFKCLMEHKIFNKLFEEHFINKNPITRDLVERLLYEYDILKTESTLTRGAQTVTKWWEWINSLIKNQNEITYKKK